MTVKEILLTAATELGFGEDAKAFLEEGVEDEIQKMELLLECFNLTENELALDYLPLYAEDTVSSSSGKILYSTFKKSPVHILQVQDTSGNPIKFKIFADGIKTQAGKVNVTYTYTPDKKTFEEESDYQIQASTSLMAYGVLSHYTLATGLFEESAIWEKKYKNAIEAVYRARPSERLRSRRWG